MGLRVFVMSLVCQRKSQVPDLNLTLILFPYAFCVEYSVIVQMYGCCIMKLCGCYSCYVINVLLDAVLGATVESKPSDPETPVQTVLSEEGQQVCTVNP